MIEKLFKWLLGESLASSVVGIGTGAVVGALGVVAQSDVSTKAIIIGAASGTLAAVAGAGGRGTGEKK